MDLKNIKREDSCKISKKVNNGSFTESGRRTSSERTKEATELQYKLLHTLGRFHCIRLQSEETGTCMKINIFIYLFYRFQIVKIYSTRF